MSPTCKYCKELENKQNLPGLVCESCGAFVHLTCLKRLGTPGDLCGDVFFDFTCAECSTTEKEIFKRNKFPWVNVIVLTLNHLTTQLYGIGNHGYFHYKTHICCFIDRHWKVLFGPNFKQKKNWTGTIAGALSVYSGQLFKSGSGVLGEAGWWKLQHSISPAVAAHIIQEIANHKQKTREKFRVKTNSEKNVFLEIVAKLGYEHLLNVNNEEVLEAVTIAVPVPPKRKKLELQKTALPKFENAEINYEANAVVNEFQETTVSDNESVFHGFDTGHTTFPPLSETSSIYSFQNSAIYNEDSDSRSTTPNQLETRLEQNDLSHIEKIEIKAKKDDRPLPKKESLFSALPNSLTLPWVEREEVRDDQVELTEYEEVQLLKQVESLVSKQKDANKKIYLNRFRAKLALRRLKRHKRLPMFDLDKVTRLLGGYATEENPILPNQERVLDRFQTSYLLENLCGTITTTNYGTLLFSQIEPAYFRSPYSGAILKPYIRRDYETAPLWLRVKQELLKKANKLGGYKPAPRASIDYSYVQPQHIAAVNNLCNQFFWPGIDLTEALQYPEYSCVVSYKRLVVGCAFLVPDAGPNTAYISFILVRPEWRGAKIASFMLYHLLQTCTGKDVTLHVSPTNPAIFLYQKFGFKVEELVQDFYEKYYDIEYKGCRHALFLRLVR